MSNIQQAPPLWERQEYDTKTGYEMFSLYYLPLPAPRTYLKAYENYLIAQNKYKAGKPPTSVPGHWKNYIYAYDKYGNPAAGARNWQERALAWDDHKAALARAADLEAAVKFRSSVQKTLNEAQDKIETAVKQAVLNPADPDQLARFVRVVYSAALDYFDLKPPERTAEEDRPFNLPTLEEWRAARLEQLENLTQSGE